MRDITVSRRSSNGRETTFCVGVRDKADRTLHDVTLVHNKIFDFADQQELLTFVFEHLLEKMPKEEIRSAFRLEDLFVDEPELEKALSQYRFVPRADPGTDWLSALPGAWREASAGDA